MIEIRSYSTTLIIAKIITVLLFLWILYKIAAIHFEYEKFSENTFLPFIAIIIFPSLLLINSTYKNIIITNELIMISRFWKKKDVYKIEDIENVFIKKHITTHRREGGGSLNTLHEYITIIFKHQKKLIILSNEYSNYKEMKNHLLRLKK